MYLNAVKANETLRSYDIPTSHPRHEARDGDLKAATGISVAFLVGGVFWFVGAMAFWVVVRLS